MVRLSQEILNISQCSFSDENVERILSVAVGAVEAAQAMQLSSELRLVLYGEVLQYGPAVSQIKLLFEAIEGTLYFSETKDPIIILGENRVVGRCEFFITSWLADYGVLLDQFNSLSHRFPSAQRRAGIRLLLAFLTGQHLFPAGLIESKLRDAIPVVNETLACLGLEPLAGNFVNVELCS